MNKREKRILEGHVSDIDHRETRLALKILSELIYQNREEIQGLEVEIEELTERILELE